MQVVRYGSLARKRVFPIAVKQLGIAQTVYVRTINNGGIKRIQIPVRSE